MQTPPRPAFAARNLFWAYAADAKCWAKAFEPRVMDSAAWTGACKDQQISGTGTLKFFISGSLMETNTGTFKHGMLNGHGKIVLARRTLEGEFKDNVQFGRGTWVWPDGTRYEGNFANGKFEGQGKFVYSGGGNFVGLFKNGQMSGRGVLTYPDGAVFNGMYEHDVFNGHGTLKQPDGASYEGMFRDGTMHGEGVERYADGAIYAGTFDRGIISGRGRYVTPRGEVFEGEVLPTRRDPASPTAPPEYPSPARRLDHQGNVTIGFLVHEDGTASDLEVLTSSGYAELDQAALESASAWRQLPASVGGHPIPMRATRTLVFKLSD